VANEADTCRKHVVTKLQAAGWEAEPHSIAEQRTITDGPVIPRGKGFMRKPPKRVDYLLRYTRDFALAVVEAKASYKAAADAVQQARTYAEMFGPKLARPPMGRTSSRSTISRDCGPPGTPYASPAEHLHGITTSDDHQ
jgi:type I restriction enzyme R subunit